MKKYRKEVIFFLLSTLLLNTALFFHIIGLEKNKNFLQIDFLSVGQGDASLITLPGGAQIMIDGGPNPQATLEGLSKFFSPFDRTIDLITSSHPQQDHIGGLPEVVRRYRAGAYISNGEKGTIGSYGALMKTLEKEGVPHIVLARGDRIRYRDSVIEILHPSASFDKNVNENSLVLLLRSASTTALFTGDIGFKTEARLEAEPVNILKVAHHGSKYSSGVAFLRAVRPKIAVIQVGENRFGHPTKETLKRLGDVGAKIYRNDLGGAIRVSSDGKTLKIRMIK